MQLVVELGDGSIVTHVSSSRPTVARWHGRQGPIVYDHEYHGEQKDGRMVSSNDSAELLRDSFSERASAILLVQDLAGWDDQPLSAFPDGTWQPVVSAPAVRVPDTALSPVQMPPIRIVETRRAVSIRKIDQVNHKRN